MRFSYIEPAMPRVAFQRFLIKSWLFLFVGLRGVHGLELVVVSFLFSYNSFVVVVGGRKNGGVGVSCSRPTLSFFRESMIDTFTWLLKSTRKVHAFRGNILVLASMLNMTHDVVTGKWLSQM